MSQDHRVESVKASPGQSQGRAGKALQKPSGKCLDAAFCLSSCEQDGPARGQAIRRRRPRRPVTRPKFRDLMGLSRIAAMVMALALGCAAAASAQQSEDTPPPLRASRPMRRPSTLMRSPSASARIQKALARPPAIRPESVRPVFRVQVFSRSPTIDDILGPDWRRGPTPLGAMSHQEFLDLVTPTDVKGYAAFDNKQAAVVAATSFALQWAVTSAMKKLDQAITERQKEAARKEVAEALAALKKARREAGLPDK